MVNARLGSCFVLVRNGVGIRWRACFRTLIFFPFLLMVLLTTQAFCQDIEKDEISSTELTREILEAAGPAFEFARTGSFRGIYFATHTGEEHFRKLAEAGINVKMVKYFCWGLHDYRDETKVLGGALEFFRLVGACAEEHGQIFLPWINWAGPGEVRDVGRRFARFVDETGHEYERTPCLLDRAYWEYSIASRTLMMARLSLTERIHGLMLDFEMYGADLLFYDFAGHLSYRDEVFAHFIEIQGLDIDDPKSIPASQRKRWLQERGLMDAYIQYHEDTIKEITADIRRRVHEINPDFLLGFYPYSPYSPLLRGVVLGYGTAHMPCILLPGTLPGAATYSHGYREDLVDDVVRHLAEIGAHALYVPGLWLEQFAAPNLAAHAYLCAKHAGGYWIYGPYAMFEDWARGRRSVFVGTDKFLEAFRQANTEILSRLHDPAHVTSLKVDPTLGAFVEVDLDRHQVKTDLVPLSVEFEPIAPPTPVTTRFQATYVLYADRGESIHLNIRCHQLGAHAAGVTFKLISPAGKVVAEGAVGPGLTKEVKLPALESGVYVLACRSGINCTQVRSPNRLSIYAPERVFRLIAPRIPLYFYVPVGVSEFYIEVAGGGGAERVKATLVDPDGKIIQTEDNISELVKFRKRPVRGQTGKVWSLRLTDPSEGMIEDVTVKLSENLPPVFSQAKQTLLIPRSP